MQLWNKQKTFVFANSWKRSRVTRIDELFKLIWNKTTPTTHSVKNQKWCSWNGQCRAFWVIRNNSIGAMLRMPSLLEWRNWLLHLWTPFERKWSQPTFSPMTIGRFLNRELRYQEGTTSRCSAWQNWSTERAFHSPQCSMEMSQKEIWRNSRSLPKRLNISWFAAQNWLDWRNVHCDGQN